MPPPVNILLHLYGYIRDGSPPGTAGERDKDSVCRQPVFIIQSYERANIITFLLLQLILPNYLKKNIICPVYVEKLHIRDAGIRIFEGAVIWTFKFCCRVQAMYNNNGKASGTCARGCLFYLR
jgi:hypothetical protein